MKNQKNFVLTLLIIFSTKICISQEVILLDFETKKISFEEKKYVELGKQFVLKIDNINMNLYNVSLNKKDSLIPTTVTFPTLDLIGFDSIDKIVGNIVNNTFSSKGNKYYDLLEQEKNLLVDKAKINTEFIIQMSKLNNLSKKSGNDTKLNASGYSLIELKNLNIEESSRADLNYLSELKEKISLLDTQLNSILDKIEKLNQAIKSEERRNQVNEKIAKTVLRIETQLQVAKPYFEEINVNVTELNLQSISYLESLYSESKNPLIKSINKLTIIEIFEKMNVLRENVESYKKGVLTFKDDYNEFKKGFKDLYESDTTIIRKDKECNKIFNDAVGALEKELSKISQTKILEYLSSIIHLENNKQRSYTSLPFQHNGDISKIDIIITPKKPEYGQGFRTEFQFPRPRYILGIGEAFYYGFGFRNDNYSVNETPTSDTTSIFNIVKEDEQKGEIGFATLLHVGHRFKLGNCDNFGFNFVIGPAVSLAAKPQLRITLGGGLSIGHTRNMFSINALWMHGYTQHRSNVFQEDIEYTKKPEQITVSKLSQSLGISLGYIYKF